MGGGYSTFFGNGCATVATGSTGHGVAFIWFGDLNGYWGVDLGGSGHCLSLALTSDFARLFVLLRLRHGLGIFPSS